MWTSQPPCYFIKRIIVSAMEARNSKYSTLQICVCIAVHQEMSNLQNITKFSAWSAKNNWTRCANSYGPRHMTFWGRIRALRRSKLESRAGLRQAIITYTGWVSSIPFLFPHLNLYILEYMQGKMFNNEMFTTSKQRGREWRISNCPILWWVVRPMVHLCEV